MSLNRVFDDMSYEELKQVWPAISTACTEIGSCLKDADPVARSEGQSEGVTEMLIQLRDAKAKIADAFQRGGIGDLKTEDVSDETKSAVADLNSFSKRPTYKEFREPVQAIFDALDDASKEIIKRLKEMERQESNSEDVAADSKALRFYLGFSSVD